MASTNGVWIPISDSLYTTYNTDRNEDILHDGGSQKWLRLRIAPDGYQPVYEDLGESGIERGLSTKIIQTPERVMGMELTTQDGRESIRHIMESLRNSLITVRDYVTVDAADIGTGYSERQVVVRQAQHTGSISDGSDRFYSNGFVISLEGY